AAMKGVPIMALVLSLACSSPAPLGPPICDGSNRLRLVYAAMIQGGLTSGSQLFADNGRPFLFVDGQCNYWVSDGAEYSRYHTGHLTPDAERMLEDQLGYRSWKNHRGTYAGSPAADAPIAVFADGDGVEIACVELCDQAPGFVSNLRD